MPSNAANRRSSAFSDHAVLVRRLSVCPGPVPISQIVFGPGLSGGVNGAFGNFSRLTVELRVAREEHIRFKVRKIKSQCVICYETLAGNYGDSSK